MSSRESSLRRSFSSVARVVFSGYIIRWLITVQYSFKVLQSLAIIIIILPTVNSLCVTSAQILPKRSVLLLYLWLYGWVAYFWNSVCFMQTCVPFRAQFERNRLYFIILSSCREILMSSRHECLSYTWYLCAIVELYWWHSSELYCPQTMHRSLVATTNTDSFMGLCPKCLLETIPEYICELGAINDTFKAASFRVQSWSGPLLWRRFHTFCQHSSWPSCRWHWLWSLQFRLAFMRAIAVTSHAIRGAYCTCNNQQLKLSLFW